MWSAQIKALATRHRVIAPDLRGFGQSPLGQVDPAAGISMEQYAEELRELVEVLAIIEPLVLAGRLAIRPQAPRAFAGARAM
jgi:pimeloyl-ACP methyl ester carboxylesterase